MSDHPIRPLIAIAAIVSALALAACGSNSDGTSSTSGSASGSEDWVTSTPPGSGPLDSVTWNLPYGEPFTLDYIQAISPSDSTVLANLCESLLHLSPEMTYEPGLAESWDSPDPTTLVFNLRPGLKFSDGSAVTTEDVVFSLERNLNPELGSYWDVWFENVKSVKATGENQVTVKLTQPDALFEQFMAVGAAVVAKKEYIQQKGKEYGTSKGGVMCVGPYELTDWTPGKSVTIEANPNYWDTEAAPETKKIEFRFVTNSQTAASALTTGEIDGTFEAPLNAWSRLESSGSGKGYLGRSTGYAGLDFSMKEGPVQDPNFRRALLRSIDKDALADAIYGGTAEPIRSVFFPTTWGYAKDVYQAGYEALPEPRADLEEAKALLAKVPNPRPVKMLSNADDEAAKQIAAYIQSEAKKVGIEIELSELPAPQYVSAAFDQDEFNKYDFGLSLSAYLDIAEPVEAGVLSLAGGGIFNSAGYDNPEVNKWVAEARQTADGTKRAELMVKVQEQAYEKDVAAIPLINWAARLYMNDRVTGAGAAVTPVFSAPWAGQLGAG